MRLACDTSPPKQKTGLELVSATLCKSVFKEEKTPRVVDAHLTVAGGMIAHSKLLAS